MNTLPHNDLVLHEIVTLLTGTKPLFAPGEHRSDSLPLYCNCVICFLTKRSVEKALKDICSEYVNDVSIRLKLRKSRGFCDSHSEVIARMGDTLAVAILMEDLLGETTDRWNRQEYSYSWRRCVESVMSRLNMITPVAPCLGCISIVESEDRFIRTLADGLLSEELWSAVESSDRICTFHSEKLLKILPPAQAERFRLLKTEHINSLRGELKELIRKNDHRALGEEWGKEKDSWLRALGLLKR